jgi:starch phosphorylase
VEKDLEKQVESLSEKIKHYLVSTTGHLVNQASDIEIFRALSYALREEIMINWAATARSIENSQQRRLYYISMEYLPGRLLVNNISSLHAHDLVKKAIHKLGRDYKKILFLEPDPGLGNGGLGRLASCLLDALATQKYPATGYGLRYQYGIFEQKMIDGFQIEKPDCWLLNENPWELRRDSSSQIVRFGGIAKNRINTHGEIVLDLQDYEEVRSLPFDFPIIGFSQNKDFNINTLRLWSTKESPHNFHLQRYNAGQIGPAAENTALTDVLYPNDYHETGKRIRLKQEFLLVSSSLQDIIFRHLRLYLTLDNFAEKVRIQINDTHPSLIIAEMVLILTTEFEYPWKKAFEITQEIVGYTNHTILREALEEWKQESLAFLLPRQYWVIEQLNTELCRKIRQEYPGDEEKVRRLSIIEKGKVRMSHLAIYGSHHINGVARLHGEILKTDF